MSTAKRHPRRSGSSDSFTTGFGFVVIALFSIAFITSLPAQARAAGVTSVLAAIKSGSTEIAKKAVEASAGQATQDLQSKGLIGTPSAHNFSYVNVSANWINGLPSACQRNATPYMDTMNSAARSHNVDVRLLGSDICAESGFRYDVCSSVGACGLGQLMPATAAGLGVTNVRDPGQSLNASATLLRGGLDKYRDGLNGFTSLQLSLAAYNAGSGNVAKYQGVPPFNETRTYIKRISGYYRDCGGTP